MSRGALPVWAGLLTPQGKCLFDFLVWADGDDLLLDCEAEAADDLDQAAVDVPPAPADHDRAATMRWPCIGRRMASEGVPDPRLAGLGRRWLAPAGRAQLPAGSSTASASACAKAWPSSATSSGSNAMPPN